VVDVVFWTGGGVSACVCVFCLYAGGFVHVYIDVSICLYVC